MGLRRERQEGGRAVALGLVLALAIPARAAPTPEDVAARQVERLAAEAVTTYKAADYTRTVELLERAYAIRQIAALLYNLAKAYEKLGDQEKSVELYRRYSDSSDADPKLRVKAEARVAAYEEAHRAHRDPDPRPQRDDDPRPQRDEDPRPHLDATPQIGAVRGRPDDAEARLVRGWQQRRRTDRIAGITLASVGLACALAGVGLSVNAYLVHERYAGALGTEAYKRSLKEASFGQAVAGDVLYAVAAASAAVGVYFLWRGYHAEKPPKKIAIAPAVTSGGGGLWLSGAF